MESKVKNSYNLFQKSFLHGSPIKEHPVGKVNEELKSLYYDFLYITAKYENTDTENQLHFLQRLMDGTGAVTVISDHIHNAAAMNSEKATQFINGCISMKLENIFFIDCLLITCSEGNINKKQVDYLSEMAAALMLDKRSIQILCEYAVAILEQSTEKYEKTNKKDTFELYKHILCYTKKFICGALVNDSTNIYLYSMLQSELNPKKLLLFSESESYNSCEIFRKNIIIENLKIDLKIMTQIHDFHVGFNCAKNIIFRSCEFAYGGSFRFHGCKNVIIDDCCFINFNNDAVFDLNHDCVLTLNNCTFKNCGYETNFISTTGGIIRSTNLNRVSISNCTFNNCFSQGNFKGGIISFNNIIEANDCHFNSCNKGTFLFYSDNGSFKGTNNSRTDSVELKG